MLFQRLLIHQFSLDLSTEKGGKSLFRLAVESMSLHFLLGPDKVIANKKVKWPVGSPWKNSVEHQVPNKKHQFCLVKSGGQLRETLDFVKCFILGGLVKETVCSDRWF